MAKKKTPGRAGARPRGKRERAVRAAGCCELVGADLRVELGAEALLGRLAMEWSYLVRNRHRWARSESELARLSRKAVADLETLGVGPERLRELAACPVVQVVVPHRVGSEDSSWAGRVFPWEFVLSRATRTLSERHPEFLVVRHLRTVGSKDEAVVRGSDPARRESLLFVESAPGVFREEFEFEDERRLLRSALEPAASGPFEQDLAVRAPRPPPFAVLANPSRSGLARKSEGVDAVHVSGIDSHLGRELLEARARRRRATGRGPATERDGLYLADESGAAELVDAERVARSFRSDAPPVLVTYNVFSSAARLASLTVAEGVEAAIGFQDRFDDSQTEQFYAVFYRQWVAGESLIECFREAFRAMREQKALRQGSGVVLWSAHDLLHQVARGGRAADEVRASTAGRTFAEVEAERRRRRDIHVRVELPPTLNYPKLHNGENLFRQLRLYKLRASPAHDVRVEVRLQVGAESYAFARHLDLTRPLTALEDEARLALSWSLASRLSESVQTTIVVRVSESEQVFFENTYPVTLLPVNEWVDDEDSGPWLPSLVLPRDPVVAEVVQRARQYLRVLADDAHVGFDGYQQLAEPEGDGDVDDDQAWVVDVQVRAIWYALLHDFGLGYINPPPTFTEQSQRLRRPSDVIACRHGTCIDLALLLAACLEYVGINPVLFLIDGHAFPGYWRVERTVESIDGGVADELGKAEVEGMQARSRPWSSGPQYWQELKRNLRRGLLVPIETVDLTAQEGFDVAVEHGLENLADREQFHTMLDVVTARTRGVTPLPL